MSSYLQGRAIHIDKHLTQVAMNYRPQGMIADQIAPIINVGHQSDIIKTYNQADLWRIEDTLRSPGTAANKTSFQVGSDNYIARNFALGFDVTVEDRANADAIFVRDLEATKTMNTQDKLFLDWENRVATAATTAANVSTSFTVASAWNDYANSDVFGDINTALDTVEDATGYRPNKMVASNLAWRGMSRNDNIVDKVQSAGVSGGGMNARMQQVADLFELEAILVGGAYYNSADEGQALSLSRIWGDNVLLYYAPDRASTEAPSFMYSFRWVKPGLQNMNVRRLPFDAVAQKETLEIGYYQDEKVTSTALGALITGVNSSQ